MYLCSNSWLFNSSHTNNNQYTVPIILKFVEKGKHKIGPVQLRLDFLLLKSFSSSHDFLFISILAIGKKLNLPTRRYVQVMAI